MNMQRNSSVNDSLLDPSAALRLEHAWDVLDRFGEALQQCNQAVAQIRLLLTFARESLQADTVLWYPGTGEESFVNVGEVDLAESWVGMFRDRFIAPRQVCSEALVHPVDDAGSLLSPMPASAAMIRMSRSRGSWLIALNFDPDRRFVEADLRVMRLARRIVLNHRQHVQTYDRLRESLFGLIRCLTATIDAKDPYTWGHSERVARIAVRLGKQMSLSANVQSDLYLGGLLHDIGKIGIRDCVLQKAGPLTEEERLHVEEHPIIGDRLVGNIKSLQHLRPCIRNHHERYDGKGYPDNISGEDIPLIARIMAVADSCDAMMATRPYRPALPPAKIDSILLAGAGSQWDPLIIAHFMACRQEVYSICQRGLGDSIFVAVERALRTRQPHEEVSSFIAR